MFFTYSKQVKMIKIQVTGICGVQGIAGCLSPLRPYAAEAAGNLVVQEWMWQKMNEWQGARDRFQAGPLEQKILDRWYLFPTWANFINVYCAPAGGGFSPTPCQRLRWLNGR